MQQGPQWHNFAPVYDYCQHIHDENMMMMPDVDDDGCLLWCILTFQTARRSEGAVARRRRRCEDGARPPDDIMEYHHIWWYMVMYDEMSWWYVKWRKYKSWPATRQSEAGIFATIRFPLCFRCSEVCLFANIGCLEVCSFANIGCFLVCAPPKTRPSLRLPGVLTDELVKSFSCNGCH